MDLIGRKFKNTQLNPKKTIKPNKTQKKPTGLGFFKKPGFLPTLAYIPVFK
jgi:hypothetical protein